VSTANIYILAAYNTTKITIVLYCFCLLCDAEHDLLAIDKFLVLSLVVVTRDVRNRFVHFGFGSVFWNNLDSVWNEIGFILLKKCGSVRIL